MSTSSIKCTEETSAELGFQDGKEGRSSRAQSFFQKCKSSNLLIEDYKKNWNQGRTAFCSFQRGKQRALQDLKIESLCQSSAPYRSGYNSSLKDLCTPQKALLEASKYDSKTSTSCFNLPAFENAYTKRLQITCSLAKAYALGKLNTALSGFCKNTRDYKGFLKSYNKGRSQHYKQANQVLEKKIKELEKEALVLKQILKSRTPASLNKATPETKAQLQSLSSKILDYKHEVELNKRKIIN